MKQKVNFVYHTIKVAVCSEINTQHISALFGHNVEFFLKLKLLEHKINVWL
jgi:tyrosine-protein phosphatase YwqE